jgi:Protein of unknown function (DUF1573)
MKTEILTFTLSILLCASVRAELKWEQTQLELHPAVGDKEAVGHFKYKNTGNTPIHFKSVHSSCGCTTAQSQKDQVAPGDSGEITATFNIGDRTGTQVKSVTVETDDPAHATTVLTLKSVIPQMLEVQPSLVYWQGGEAPKAKTVSVKAGKDFPVKEIKVTPVSTDFQVKVNKVGEGEFKIEVQPRDTTRPVATTFAIQPDNSPKAFYLSARVINSPPPVTTAVKP